MSDGVLRGSRGSGATELKFLVSPEVADAVRTWARCTLSPDPHGSGVDQDRYHTSSLYFDTPTFSTFHRIGSFGRNKFRIRRYDCGEVAFLERKRKNRGLITKQRTVVPIAELACLSNLESGIAHLGEWQGAWFAERLALRKLGPVCQIDYDRTARVSMTNYGPVRLTLDESVRAVPITTIGFVSNESTRVLVPQVILELKYHYEAPTMFRLLIEEFMLNPASVSKYRLAAADLGLAREGEELCPTS